MPAGLAVLFVIAIVVVCVALLAYAAVRSSTPPRPSRKERAYISELEDTIENIRSLAYDSKDIDPGLADIIIDELKEHRKRVKIKELE